MNVNIATKSIAKKTSPISDYERRFYFIEDPVLKKNICIAFQYINFLIASLDEESAEDTTISSSIHKDMIVYTATIVEACLHYCLRDYIKMGVVKSTQIMPTKWETKNHKAIHKISENEEVCGAIRFKKTEYLTEKTQFVTINRAAKKAEILTDELYEKSEQLRTMRNKIHLAGLSNIDGTYKKRDSESAFKIAKEVIERIEICLNSAKC